MLHDSYTELELRHPDSNKWSLYPADVLPMWIADMDFPIAPSIVKALQERLTQPLGYAPAASDEQPLIQLLTKKLASFGLDGLGAANLKFLPSVVPALYASIFSLTKPGDRVVMLTPVYHPFHQATQAQGRIAHCVPLLNTTDGWQIDWEQLDLACQDASLLMLCHPHNPVGRVWNTEELARLRELVVKHQIYVVSDELHADLCYEGISFESFAADPKVRPYTVTVTGPCKAFNIAGLGIGVMAVYNTELLQSMKEKLTGLCGHPSSLALTMWQVALEEGQEWLSQTVAYLQENRDVLEQFLSQHLPKAKVHTAQATYLAWVDFGEYGHDDVQQYLLDNAKVAVHTGCLFAPDDCSKLYQNFVRINFAMPRKLLLEALERIQKALNQG